ncbi:MAG: ATP-binding cassette domain-containing protein [Motilibacteraceae bacterium]
MQGGSDSAVAVGRTGSEGDDRHGGTGSAAGVVEVRGLTKHFGSGPRAVHAVQDLTFRVLPGRVTGFLGPNGAGKTTTLRMLLGLVRPTAGQATIGGRLYAELVDPLHVVGAALEATGFHPGRTARDHLRVLCAQAGLPPRRADEVLALVGLAEAAARRVSGFSLGMRQRLALASALLGDPQVLLLDEPANGLDPAGIAWLRGFLRHLAAQGRTVLVSSHVLSEVAQTVDDVVIIARGRLVRTAPLAELVASTAPAVRVRTPDVDRLRQALSAAGVQVLPPGAPDPLGPPTVLVPGADAALVGRLALQAGVELHELVVVRSDLEDVFLELTADRAPAEPGTGTTGEAEGVR